MLVSPLFRLQGQIPSCPCICLTVYVNIHINAAVCVFGSQSHGPVLHMTPVYCFSPSATLSFCLATAKNTLLLAQAGIGLTTVCIYSHLYLLWTGEAVWTHQISTNLRHVLLIYSISHLLLWHTRFLITISTLIHTVSVSIMQINNFTTINWLIE